MSISIDECYNMTSLYYYDTKKKIDKIKKYKKYKFFN